MTNGFIAVVIIGRPAITETRTPIPITLLTPLSLASISRGSPATRLSSRPATLTNRISAASALTFRSRSTLHRVRTAGTTLLHPSAAMVLIPRPLLRR